MKGFITYKKEKLWDKVHTIKNDKFYTGVNDLKELTVQLLTTLTVHYPIKNNCFEICLNN